MVQVKTSEESFVRVLDVLGFFVEGERGKVVPGRNEVVLLDDLQEEGELASNFSRYREDPFQGGRAGCATVRVVDDFSYLLVSVSASVAHHHAGGGGVHGVRHFQEVVGVRGNHFIPAIAALVMKASVGDKRFVRGV